MCVYSPVYWPSIVLFFPRCLTHSLLIYCFPSFTPLHRNSEHKGLDIGIQLLKESHQPFQVHGVVRLWWTFQSLYLCSLWADCKLSFTRAFSLWYESPSVLLLLNVKLDGYIFETSCKFFLLERLHFLLPVPLLCSFNLSLCWFHLNLYVCFIWILPCWHSMSLYDHKKEVHQFARFLRFILIS